MMRLSSPATILAVLAMLALATGAACQTRPGDAAAMRESAPVPAATRVSPPRPAEPPAPALARPGEDIVYRVRFVEPHTHYIEVEAVVPALRGRAQDAAGQNSPAVELFLPVWTPGSYLVREYSRHLERVSAATLAGQPLAIDKISKNRWRVAAGAEDTHVVVRYRVYAREMSVRSSFVDERIAVLNGASVFLTVAGGESRGHDVTLEPAPGWPQSVTSLQPHPGGEPHRYLAPDYDTLIDSPIVLGDGKIQTFEVDGIPHRIATFGGGTLWDHERVARDTEALVRAQIRFWGVIPYRDYVFLSVLEGAGGGLEHASSTLIMGHPWMTRARKDYRGWMGLVSHEYFHAWNIKRMRPQGLGPFDYEREVYTPSLWIAEGITSYYDDLLVRRAGIIDDKEYLETLSEQIADVENGPGRKVQPLSASSYDAWIKFYRPDENSTNTAVSYYRKGAVVGFLLDAEIRRRTRGERSLDDVMRLAYQRYSGERGYTPEEFRAVASEVAGSSLDDFFARAVDSTDDLDYGGALELFGLRFAAKPAGKDAAGAEPAGWLGATTRQENGRLMVTEVRRETPAFDAGINVGDEILATDDYRVPPDGLDTRLGYYRPGDQVNLLVARRGKLHRVSVTLGKKPEQTWKLELLPKQGRDQSARRNEWLTGKQ